MLQMIDRKTGSRRTFYINDAHHHIGEDVDGNENIPVGDNGTYDFSKRLEENVIERLKGSGSRYEVFEERPIVPMEECGSDERCGLIDQFVVFPMKDKFRDDGEITYSKSNENISRWINSEEHGERLLGFGRADPDDIEKAREMIKTFPSKYGLVGLKIHPDSERFMLDSNQILQLYIDCARLNLPIIFHTGYTSDVEKIHDGINRTISLLVENKMEELIGQLNVIVGHFSYKDEEAFRYLSHPCLYGELSTLSSSEEFFRLAMEHIDISRFMDVTLKEFRDDVRERLEENLWNIFHVSTNWSNKLMLGTDHPFLPRDNIVDLLETLFCTELSEDLDPMMIQNILGKNLSDILTVNLHMSTFHEDTERVGESFERRKKQVEYYIEVVERKGVDTGPIERKKRAALSAGEEEALEKITKGLTIAKKGYTLARMLEEKSGDGVKEASEAARKGQYAKGIKILKDI